jgi:osmotically-inducible protein OsmY
MGRFKAVAIYFVIVAFAAGCQSLTGRSASANVDDSAITASVKMRLVADGTSNLTRVDVDTNHGTVYLHGAVDTAEQRARAEQIASQANGVKAVVNNLQVVQKR